MPKYTSNISHQIKLQDLPEFSNDSELHQYIMKVITVHYGKQKARLFKALFESGVNYDQIAEKMGSDVGGDAIRYIINKYGN